MERKKAVKLSHYQYKPDEIEAIAKAEYEKRLAKGETTSLAECRRIVQNLKERTTEDESAKEELRSMAAGGAASFNLKRFSKEEKDYAAARWAKYRDDLGAKGIDTEAAPNDFAVRRIIELEIQIQRQWSFIGVLPIMNMTKVHNDSIKILGNELRQMLDSLNALEKSAGKPEEVGGSISDLAQTMAKGKEKLKKDAPKVDKQVADLREKKGLNKNGEV